MAIWDRPDLPNHAVTLTRGRPDPGLVASAAQCEAETIPTAPPTSIAWSPPPSSPTVVEAAASPHWRVYACTPINGRPLEGYIDLLYRQGSEGLVVVDYKMAAS
jgi:hypothetical protein